MAKIRNLIYLLIFGGVLLSLKFFVVNNVFRELPKDASLWFTSGLLLIVLGIFVTEKYFTKSLDVLVNIITLGVVLLMLDNPAHFKLWTALLIYSGAVGLLALISFIVYDEEKNPDSRSQKIAHSFGIIARFLGGSKMLFSIVFILSLFNYFIFSLNQNQNITKEQLTILLLIVFWAMVLLIEPIDKKLFQPLIRALKGKNRDQLIGKVIKRISPNVLVVECCSNIPQFTPGELIVLDDVKQSNKYDGQHVLMYLYSEHTENRKLAFFYSINQKIKEISKEVFAFIPSRENKEKIKEEISVQELYKNRENLIGFVYTGSDIDILKIKMIEGADESKKIKEGDLISVDFYDNSTKYQIINVETYLESVDGQNKQGIKIITAQQIGYWRSKEKKFEDIGWTPEVNTPVFLETMSEEIKVPEGNNYRVGVVPRSQYPIFIDLDECINHHIAIIGKTGTGKSRMAAKILEKMAQNNYKIVIFEVDKRNKQSLNNYIAKELIEEQNSNNFDINKSSKSIVSVNWQSVDKDKESGTINFSDASAAVIEKIIDYQLKNEEQKMCIVMEEAYDFIPESTFGKQDFGQAKVSRISQMMLKCRKHNIGFIIITQRTALVTKTILYQCHTIIALQSFDETSKTFMSAYINQKYLDSMSILPRYRAIVVGKGSSCDKPVIVDFYDSKLAKK